MSALCGSAQHHKVSGAHLSNLTIGIFVTVVFTKNTRLTVCQLTNMHWSHAVTIVFIGAICHTELALCHCLE